jgi:hypothetical protein
MQINQLHINTQHQRGTKGNDDPSIGIIIYNINEGLNKMMIH